MKTAKLGTALKLHVDAVPIDTNATYPMSGVYSYGRGLIKREPLSGANTSYKKFHRLHTNDFVLSQLKGWEGAMALVTEEFDGYFLSPQFPTFRAIPEKLDIHYLNWYCKQPKVWAELLANARGMGARRSSVSPKQFLSLEIPLPSLDEQRRIVARIEALAGRVAEAQRLRVEAIVAGNQLISSLHQELAGDRTVKLDEILTLDEVKIPVVDGGSYPQVGVRGFGNGLFVKEATAADQTSYKHFNRLYAGALVLSQVKGWEGALAVADESLAGKFVSPEYRTFRCIPNMASSDYLARLVVTPWFWTKLAQVERGMGGRRQRTRPEQFLALEVSMPTYEQQLKALPVLERLDKVAPIQAATQAELDALLPAILDQAFRGEL